MNKLIVTSVALLFSTTLSASTMTANIISTDGKTAFGQVDFEDSQYGLLIKPQLQGLPAGLHGFHLHQHPDCSNAGMAAAGHYDPKNTDTHQGPYGNGHLGDLPVLAVDSSGAANTVLLAPRLKTSDINNLALMIHAGGDNYSDSPSLGGGGARIGCGKISAAK